MTASAMQGDREKCLEVGMDDYLAKPVRPQDVRTILERWAPIASGLRAVSSAVSPTPTTSTGEPAAGPSAAQSPPKVVAEPPPVDMERLVDFSDGNEENLRELVDLYLKQTSEQLEQLKAAVAASDPQEIKRLAHSAAGASATCGMGGLVMLLRELERQGLEGKLNNASDLCQQVLVEFKRIQSYLTDEHAMTKALQSSAKV
jgi:HPt (histidine-containing phosphotransfer) domain-containing protein